MSLKPRDLLLMLLIQLIWGVNFVVVKVGLAHMPPLFFVALRFSLAALILLPFAGLPRQRLRQVIPLSFTLGVMHFTLIFTGMHYLDAATTAIAVQLQVPFSAVLAAFFFGETLHWRRITGMVIAFAGIVLIAGQPRFLDNPWPLASVIAAALVWSVANVQVKIIGDAVDAVHLNGWIALLAAPQLLLISYILEGDRWPRPTEIGWPGLFALVYQALIVAALSYWIWYNLMRRYPVNQVMPFMLLQPLIGVAAGAALLSEDISTRMVAGGMAILAGVAIIILRRPAVIAPSTKTGI
ncbi:MAG TPA: EamA family transporter [Candidatus Cybelea sp.]|nr:EamA family transporter [Candidatus Cybelea sp.]